MAKRKRKAKQPTGPTIQSLEAQRAKTTRRRLAVVPRPSRRSALTESARGAAAAVPESDAIATITSKFPALEIRKQPVGDKRCVAYAFATAMDLRTIVVSAVDPDTHARYSVDDAFQQMGGDPAIMRGVTAARKGFTNELCWPHGDGSGCADIENRRVRATIEQPISAKPREIISVLCSALDAQIPLVTAIPLFSNFKAFTGADVYRAKGKVVGAHALVVIDYEEDAGGTSGCWVALNSWGDTWGDSGRVRIRWHDVDLRPEESIFRVLNVVPVED